MKKILLALIMIISLFLLVGCGKEKKSNEPKPGEVMSDVLNVKIDKYDISLDTTGTLNSMTFKYSSKSTYNNLGTYCIMDYMDGSDLVVRVAISYFENRILDDAMKSSSVKFKDIKKINSKEWNVYEGKSKDNKKMIVYAHQRETDSYTITFMSDKDINSYKDAFMNTVFFN